MDKGYLSFPKYSDWLWGPSSLVFNEFRGSIPGKERPRREVFYSPSSNVTVKNEWIFASILPTCRGVRFSTQLHLMSRLRMSGSLPLFSLHAFMAWIRTALLLLRVISRKANRLFFLTRGRRNARFSLEELCNDWIQSLWTILLGMSDKNMGLWVFVDNKQATVSNHLCLT